jgi:hypothetical protein
MPKGNTRLPTLVYMTISPLPPKTYDFDEGNLLVELLDSQVRIKAQGMAPGRYKAGDTWIYESYPTEQTARARFHSFSADDANYWMQRLYLIYMDSPDDY